MIQADVIHAAPISIANFSFETTGSAGNDLIFDSPDGTLNSWEFTRTGLVPQTLSDITFGSSGFATDGSSVAQLEFLVGALGTVSIFQNTGVSFLANSIYTLSFDIDQRSLVNLLSNGSASIFDGSSAVATLGGSSLLTLLDGSGPLQPVTLEYITGAVAPSGQIGIGFTAGGGVEAINSGFIIDNVRLDVVPVPEPGTVMMIALGGIWFHLRRRRSPA